THWHIGIVSAPDNEHRAGPGPERVTESLRHFTWIVCVRHLSSAIIATPPPGPLLEKWFARITMHLTEKRNRHRRKTHHRRV
ncbi:MAG: hypothetical protein WCF79_04475, partial [Rhodomicrobium sp.]